MDRTTIWFGAGLVVLGLVGYVGSGADSLTALIPSLLGLILAGLGLAASDPGRRTRMIQVAVALAVIGILGSAMGIADLPDLLTGEDVERPWAVAVQSIMAVALLAYVVVAARSLRAERRAGA